MEELRMPEMLTPEIIEAIANNAEALKSVLGAQEENVATERYEDGCHSDECCCPKILKFKFFFCYVTIINKNAECQEKKHYD